jgi:nucleoid-associated protein EbfC
LSGAPLSPARRELNVNKNLLRQAQQMQARMGQIQEEIAATRTEASAGGGVVKVTVLGGSSVEAIAIDPQVVDPDDVEMLQDLVLAAVNEALENAQKMATEKMSAITGGLNIPGLG